MKHVTDAKMRDVKAAIANNVASMLPKSDRVASVKGLLQCDEDEARELIARGRRMARQDAKDRSASINRLCGTQINADGEAV